MHDPDTLIASFGPFTLWHHDPCRGPGGDDSCGWFMRAHHGNKETLAKIERAIAFHFDNTYKSDSSGQVYLRGLFCPNGDPNFSVMGIVLNMFFDATNVFFHDWKKSRAWMRKNLFDILMFAENPTDSLRDGIVGTFRDEKFDREERIHAYATCIYGWILREQRPWYRHPRWHVHHWRISCRPFWRRSEKPCCEPSAMLAKEDTKS